MIPIIKVSKLYKEIKCLIQFHFIEEEKNLLKCVRVQ